MLEIEGKLISEDVLEKGFICDLSKCKGACCVEGDAGAPITQEEEIELKKILNDVKPYMNEEGIKAIEANGVAVLDAENDLTTTLVNNKECAFSFKEKGIVKCSIERAHNDGKISFKKPISCHLFPIRTTTYKDFEAINYEQIKICKSACACGSKLKVPLYIFLKEPLIRKYGKDWYDELIKVASLIK